MRNNRISGSKRRKRRKTPAAVAGENPPPFPQMRRPATVPGVGAVLERARIPYNHRPLSEDDALNLICDARQEEPAYPIEKLLKKLGK